jgi:hypothetical protein
MTDVLIVPPNTVDTKSRRDLKRAGVIVIETSEPEKCRFLRAGEELSGSDLLWAALSALQSGGSYTGSNEQRVAFTKLIFQLIDSDYQRRHRPPSTDSEAA